MRHLPDGTLRRLYDEPDALDQPARAHYQACSECRLGFSEIAAAAREAGEWLAVPAVTVDPAAAHAGVRDRLAPSPWWPAALVGGRPGGLRWQRPALVAGLAAALVAVMAATPLASSLVRIFEPTSVSPVSVSVSSGDFNALAPLAAYGDVRWTQQPTLRQVDTAAEAARVSGLPEITVRTLPPGVPSTATYAATGSAGGSFTFRAAKARAAVAGSAASLPPLPSNIDGSTLSVTAGPAEVALYGDLSRLTGAAGSRAGRAGDAAGSGSSPDAAAIAASLGPTLAIAVMRAPTVTSTGVTVAQLKAYLLSIPGLSAGARAEIAAIDSPTGNLPIPVPAGQASAARVTVQGVQGTAVGDNTGLGAALIWIRGGNVHVVAGTLTQAQLLSVANGL